MFKCENMVDTEMRDENTLSETSDGPQAMRWKGNIIMSHGTRNSAGVAILFSEHINNILEIKEIVKGRLLLTQIEYKDTIFVFINIYAPNYDSERMVFFSELKKVMDKYNTVRMTLLMIETGKHLIASQVPFYLKLLKNLK